MDVYSDAASFLFGRTADAIYSRFEKGTVGRQGQMTQSVIILRYPGGEKIVTVSQTY